MNFEALRASTLPGLLVERAGTRPERVAFRAKELGIWRETTWRELAADTRALFMYRHPRVRPLVEVEDRGREALAGEPDVLARLVPRLSADAPATIIYTSGTTGHPKGAVYRHGPHLAACANIVAHYPILARREHRAVAMLPLCHAMGRNLAITMPLIADIVPHYPESVETFAEALYEIQPTFVFTVPRYLQKFAAHLLVGLDQSSWIKRAAYRAAMAGSRRALELRWSGDGIGAPWRLSSALARATVFRWLLEKVGFARVELVI